MLSDFGDDSATVDDPWKGRSVLGLTHDLLLSEKGRFTKPERPLSAPAGASAINNLTIRPEDIIDISGSDALSPRAVLPRESRLRTPPPLERCTESSFGMYPARPASVPPSPAAQPPLEGPGIRRKRWPRAASGAVVGFTVACSQSPRYAPMRYGAALVRQQRLGAQNHCTPIDARSPTPTPPESQREAWSVAFSPTNRPRGSLIQSVVQRPLSQLKRSSHRRRPLPAAVNMATAHQ
mmetsp:Transcript_69301/g.123423  ORF Transcript_69301/g.123423 Transcript_69301/m.123423 type:complete len:237 (+) Transcript_69301:119-829(+)